MKDKNKKKKLILVHSLGSNAEILNGLDTVLDRYIETKIIDLPGFSNASKPLDTISFDYYVDYFERELEKYISDEILIGGISFGFSVIARANLEKFNIKGILAIEPFLGYRSLKLREIERKTILELLNLITFTKLEDALFREEILRIYYRDLDKDLLRKIIHDYDPRTFIETLKLILTDETTSEYLSDKYKYALMINPYDSTLNVDYILDIFKKYKHRLIKTNMPHYPEKLSSEYFSQNLPDVGKLLEYFSE